MSIKAMFIDISGQQTNPKPFSLETTIEQAAKFFEIDTTTQQLTFKLKQTAITDMQKTLGDLVKELNIAEPILPIRYFARAIGGSS